VARRGPKARTYTVPLTGKVDGVTGCPCPVTP
jgi:hypothetical protein